MKRYLLAVLVILLPALTVQAAPRVFVSIAPQKYFVDRVSNGTAEVSIMIEPGANPHVYEPKPRQMTALSGADLYFTIGDSFDQIWVPRLTAATPDLIVVHTEDGVQKMPMTADHDEDMHGHDGDGEHHADAHADEAGHDKHHDAEHEQHDGDHHAEAEGHEHHHHEGLDPHIWLDPNLVRIQAARIRDGLTQVDPAAAAIYAAGYAGFDRELTELDRRIRDILAPVPADRRTFLVFHPSWGYFAHAYGLHQIAMEVEGKEPSPRDMAKIIDLAKDNGVRVIFVQPQFSEKSASVLARQIGADIVRLDPLAGNWAENLLQAATAIARSMQPAQ